MDYSIDTTKRTITITDNGASIVLTPTDVCSISHATDRAFYFLEDIQNEIEVKIEAGSLPEEAHDNKDFINKVLNTYCDLREEYDGSDEGVSWRTCIDLAFQENPYSLKIA